MMSHEEAEKVENGPDNNLSKRDRILQACHDGNIDLLRELATSSGGLVDDGTRRTAWPMLLGYDGRDHSSEMQPDDLPRHNDEDQVQLDVDRSFVYYPEAESDSKKDARKAELSRLIVAVLRRHQMLHYFQGYHDIVQVLLLVLGMKDALLAVERLSLLRIRDFMLPTMTGTEPHLYLVPVVLHAADPKLAHHLSQTQPFFALAATLTLYAHEIEEYGSIARLFDFLLAHEAAIPVYLFAATILSRKDKLLDIEADEPEMLHSILSKLPRPLDLEYLIQQTMELYQKYPPERLPGRAWARVSANSVLKTTHDLQKLSKQTLQDGERYFEFEAAEIRRQEDRIKRNRRLRALAKRYRRPAGYTGVAILVAVIAMLARGQSSTSAATAISTTISHYLAFDNNSWNSGSDSTPKR